MKKIGIVSIALLFLSTPLFAARDIEEITPTISGTKLTNYYLVTSVAKYTDGIIVEPNVGFAAISLDLTTGSDLDVSFEVSHDDVTYWTPKDTSNTDLGAISTAIATDRWIVFTPRTAKFMRFKLDPDADTMVTDMKFIYLRERP